MYELFIMSHVWFRDALGNAIRVAGTIFSEGLPALSNGVIGF